MNYIVKNESALIYECGYSNDNAIFLKLGKDSFFITDARYGIVAKEQIKNSHIIIAKDIYKECKKLLNKSKIKKVTIDPKEWSLYDFEKISSLKISFQKYPNFSQQKRIIKTKKEISIIKRSAKINKKRFSIFAKSLKEGMSEAELNYLAKKILSKNGTNELSFEPITAIDTNSAKPHAVPESNVLKNGSIVLFDGGIKYKHYCSDRTRCIEFKKGKIVDFDKNQTFDDKKIQKIYEIVKDANNKAISLIKPGIKANKIDKAARDYIEKKGYGKYFVHSTGHGVGLDIHELPIISYKSKSVLEEGMVFTIEPGIYLENRFGIRVEDMVVVTKDGCEVLSE